jgi:signal peptide peptidase SppA
MLNVDNILAIEPECYRRWADQAREHTRDPGLLAQLRAPEAAVKLAPARKSVGDIAVVEIAGFITPKPNIFTLLFGGTAAASVAGAVRAAMAEPSIGAVVLSIDSPGGMVAGIPEAAAVMRAARGPKPFIAVVDPVMASAAYWLGAQADEVVSTPSGISGSIGVVVTHVDESEALKRAGLAVTEITHGRRKTEDSGVKPLTDEARAAIQARIDYFGGLFESDVAKGRRVSVGAVRAKFGEGAVFTARDAAAAGLVDRVATMEDVLGELAAGRRPAGPRAMADPVELAALAALGGLPRLKGEES